MHLRETLRDGFNWRGCISWFVNIKDCSDTFSTFLQNKSHVCLSHVFRRRSYELSGQVFSLSCEADHHRVTHSLKLSRFSLFLPQYFGGKKFFFTPIFWGQKCDIYLQEELGAIIHLALPEIKHSSQKIGTNQKPTGCFCNWYPPKKLKYGKPRLGESTST